MNDDIQDIIKQNGLLKALFSAIPCSVMIIDQQYNVHIINDYMERNFSNDRQQVFLKSMGEVLHCLNQERSQKPCGKTSQCADCQIYSVGMQALTGNKVTRKWVKKKVHVGQRVEEITLLVASGGHIGKEPRKRIAPRMGVHELSKTNLMDR